MSNNNIDIPYQCFGGKEDVCVCVVGVLGRRGGQEAAYKMTNLVVVHLLLTKMHQCYRKHA